MPNHHYLPQNYLRRFANARGQIRVYKTGMGEAPFLTSVRNAAAKPGFYQVEIAGQNPESIESLLSRIEGNGKSAIDRMLGGRFPPPVQDRLAVAQFMGFQLVRTPENRRLYEMTVDRRLKMMAHAMNEERTKNFLDREGLDASPAAVAEWMAAFRNIEDYEFRPAGKGKGHSHMALMLEMGPLVAKSLAERSWQLGQDIRGSLVTSDHPVLGFSNPTPYESLIGLGTENAEWFIFPLSPKDVLILSASSRRETRVVLDDATTGRYNEMIAGFGYQYVFQHPESPRIDNLIPAEPRQIASGEDLEASILRVGSTDDLLRELYGS